jgi:hypothetical protein
VPPAFVTFKALPTHFISTGEFILVESTVFISLVAVSCHMYTFVKKNKRIRRNMTDPTISAVP